MNQPLALPLGLRMGLTPLALFVFCAAATAQDQRVPVPMPPFRAGLPSVRSDLQWLVTHKEDERGVIRARARMAKSGLRLAWEWFPEWPTAKRRESASSFVEFEGVLTEFTVLEDGVVVLVGQDGGAHEGCTRLERVDLGAATVDVDAHTLRAGEPIARRTLWMDESPGRNVIAQLSRWPGEPPTRLVALMWDTPEIRAFDLKSGTWSRLASAHAFGAPGVLDVPELVRTYHSLRVEDDGRVGFRLSLSTVYYCMAGENDRVLVLGDVNRDGILDGGSLIDANSWCGQGP